MRDSATSWRQQHQSKGWVLQKDIYGSSWDNHHFMDRLKKLFWATLKRPMSPFKGFTQNLSVMLHCCEMEPTLLLLKFLYKQELSINLLGFYNWLIHEESSQWGRSDTWQALQYFLDLKRILALWGLASLFLTPNKAISMEKFLFHDSPLLNMH